jgi:EAL domain-containing protein (putative c-di-GMP-specific phosphodiesterase class I)
VAKSAGGSQFAEYQPQLHKAALDRTELREQLRSGLENDEFIVYYQPIFDLASGWLVGTEALVRWNHPMRGMVSPAEFIPAAEESGLIVGLGTWVLATACRQTAIWQAARCGAAPLSVSVNLSPRQLTDPSLVSQVAEILCDAGLDASALCLEVTETAVITDFAATAPTLHDLRALGVSLALDDFGTGYSSLSYLKQLPVNSVKIDSSFVSDLGADTPNAQIVDATIKLAHALGMSVTAEGIETTAEREALRAMNCDRAQGYLLGRPVDAQGMRGLLDREASRDLPRPRRELSQLALVAGGRT